MSSMYSGQLNATAIVSKAGAWHVKYARDYRLLLGSSGPRKLVYATVNWG